VVALAYAALLAASLGWGWMNGATPAQTVAGTSPGTPAADVIPADAYAPASYQPAERGEQPDDEARER
jgi:hypothetical protein